jgi:competence protein ComEC
MLHPLSHESPKHKPNALSCVLRVEDAQGRSLLLTGDIEREQERLLAEMNTGATLQSDGLLVPHHGSRTSSSEGFLQAVQPSWALAQAGYRNRYGHPAPAVVQRYADRGIDFWSSPWCGALRWQGDALHCWRALQPRHWHDHPPANERRAQVP